MQMPVGVAILGSLHGFNAIFLMIHVLISIPFIIATFFSDAGLGALATLETFWDWIMIGVHSLIAGAIFTRKSWSRTIIMITAGIGILFGVINFFSGNMFSIFSIIIYVIVIGYMKKPHVREWFSDKTV